MEATQKITGRARAELMGEGPWLDEPDRMEWSHNGVPCIALRQMESGHWCGYVGVEPGHPWYKGDWDSVDASVHGGITYGRECEGDVCHVPAPGEPEHLWWVGFDCAHSGDFCPVSFMRLRHKFPARSAHETYRNLAYVRAEVEHLARQAKAAKP